MKLTLPQQDICFEQLLYPNDPIYNIGAKIMIEGNIAYEVLNKAYIALIDQHDAYRSILIQYHQETRIKTLTKYNASLGFVDFSNQAEADEKANIYMQETFKKPFDFRAEELLHKFILVKVHDTLFYLFSVYHHIITDGWGTSLMFQRLVKNFNELIEHGKIETQYPYSYKDFVIDDEKYYNSDSFEKDKAYWKGKFKNLPERLFERIDETINVNKSNRKELIIKRSVYNKLSSIAKESRSSTFHIILAVLYLYFGRKHQNEDFAIGLPVLNRSKSIFKKTVGLFMGVSALRMKLDFEETFENLVYSIKQQLRQDYRHQRFPLGKLIQELDAFQDKDRLFNITLSYEKQNYSDHFHNTKTKVIPLTHQAERVALAIYIREFDELEDVKIDFDYNINYFNNNSINQVIEHFEELIKCILLNTKKKLSDYQYITTTEQQQLLYNFNQTGFNYPRDATLLSFFCSQVKNKSSHIAVRDKINAFTYKELDVLSDRIADYLLHNFDDRSPIAVLMDRSASLVVILIGIFKSGRAYIPLDPSFPEERLEYIITNSEVKCVVGRCDLKDTIKTKIRFIHPDVIINSNDFNNANKIEQVKPFDTAYIIYTSGSTGKPKGVEISHQSLLNFLLSIQQTPKIDTKDLLYSVTTQSFDISILEFFTPLLSGATLYVADKNTLEDPLTIVKELEEIKPSVIQGTPSFFQMLFNADWKGDKHLKVLCGGDLLSESLAKKLIVTCAEVWNMYGPTETTIWSSIKKIIVPEDASNIGKPIHNTSIYILDKYRKLLPIGTMGDIYIGGDGLAKGYFKNELLTQEKFTENPFNKNEKIYNTGDLGRWNINGEIEFLGRNDTQVKIRGFRIELGEIETKLNQLAGIKSSVVIAKKSKIQEAILVAYVVLSQKTFSSNKVIKTLRKELPEYMIPYIIVPIEKFPLTPNNKIDRKSLTSREINPMLVGKTYKEPTSDLEIKLCEYYKEVLKFNNKIGVTDNFFTLGGHSLSAVKLIGIIEKELQFQISLKTIFDYPTIELLSSFLKGKEVQDLKPIIPISERSYYPITLPQYAIWLASLQDEKSIAYNMFRSFSIEGLLDKTMLETTFNKVISKYELLRTNFVEFEGYPHQKINLMEDVNFEIDEFFIKNSEKHEALENYVNQWFDLENKILLRVGLFHVENKESILTFVTHHIIMDGWSLEILIKEIVDYYNVLTKAISFKEKTLSFQFKDYVVWQHELELKNQNANQKFWQQHLKGYKWKRLISYDQEPKSEKYSGTFYRFNWDKIFFDKLKVTTLKQKITLHTLLITTFNILIFKMQELEDICLGTINSGRSFSGLHSQMGMFVKTLPLRSKVNPNKSVAEMLQQVQENLLAIDRNQDIPSEILSTLRFEAILVLQNQTFDYKKIKVNEDLILKSHPVDSKYNRLPLLFDFSVDDECLHCSIHYDTYKYEKETIDLLVLKYKKILDQVIDNTNVLVKSIDADLAFEKKKAIEIEFNF
ncbi:amino acid adenylation domain-containing protein [Aquimarina algiphila]|uniref:amino acid adenylation domain-containing protein n=1 Tax=Aquimarina algiphila TaxID=2047982 RepID=UPI0024909997|nr:amino acid adenylation domain-containing protein [Aquimarina algiphila]